MNTKLLLMSLLLITLLPLSYSTRSNPNPNPNPNPNSAKPRKTGGHHKGDDGSGGFFGPGGGFDIPGLGPIVSGGYGFGFGGPKGGYSHGGTIRPTMVCKDKGPCYNMKLTCPAKCFSSFSRSGKGYGSGGGGGGCTMDCKKKCVAYC